MPTELIIVLIVIVIIVAGWFGVSTPSGSRIIEGNKLRGIRREQAFMRKTPAGHPKLFTTAVEAKGRKIYLDVYQGSKQPYVKISEVGYGKDDQDAYTIIVYGDELKGLHKAIEACVRKLQNSSALV
jgi:hypothetical protein